MQCNDDSDREGCSKASSVEVDVSAFTTYFIVVDGIGSVSDRAPGLASALPLPSLSLFPILLTLSPPERRRCVFGAVGSTPLTREAHAFCF